MNASAHSLHVRRAVVAGLLGTAVLTTLWTMEPAVGLPEIAVGQILSSFMSVSVAQLNVGIVGGWVAHLAIGVVLALAYAAAFADRLPGSALARGAAYGLMLFCVAQLVFMPLVGAGFFARGDIALLIGSLLGNVAYGLVVAWIYDLPARRMVAVEQGNFSQRKVESP